MPFKGTKYEKMQSRALLLTMLGLSSNVSAFVPHSFVRSTYPLNANLDPHQSDKKDANKDFTPTTRPPIHTQGKAESEGEVSQDATRRNIIQAPAFLAMALAQIQNNPDIAWADEDILQLDQKKVFMQLDQQNLPKKYETSYNKSSNNASGGTDDAGVPGEPVLDALTESELRRIAIFEKAAPSVVYIDTYQEQRDAFSTNTMEVPVGTGSGFVWDDKGHIITNCKLG